MMPAITTATAGANSETADTRSVQRARGSDVSTR